MSLNTHLISQLQGSAGLLSMHLNDLSEADLFTRPVPNANHGNWQLGHLAIAETNMLTDSGIPMPALPEDMAAKYSKETSKLDDASKFLKKDQLISLLQATRNATIGWAKKATPEELATPTAEKLRSFAATRGDLLAALCLHDAMHMGQLQVKLGKPILF